MQKSDEAPSRAGRTLIIHIGDHKTGSTSIQHALAKSEITIEGTLPYYGVPLNHNHLPRMFRAVLSKPHSPEGQKAEATLSALAERIAAASPPLWIVSAEEFEGIDPAGLKRLVDRYFGETFGRVRVVAYVRPHLQRVVSEYAERTKIGSFTGDMEAFFDLCVRRKLHLYAPRFRKWQKVFGDDFVLRPFLRSALRNGDLLDDFIFAALGPVAFSVAPQQTQNESLSLEDLLRVKFLHGQISERDWGFHHSFGWALARMIGTLPKTETATKVRIHRGLAERAAAHYRADARKLDQTFFADSPGMAERLQADVVAACEAAQPSRAEEAFSAHEMRSLALSAAMIAEMLENGKTPWFEHFHKRRLKELHGAQG